MLNYVVSPSDREMDPGKRSTVLADPGYGQHFTDHMVTARWTSARGWHGGQVRQFESLQISPAAAILHYGQAIIEGLKAYRHIDGSVWAFRPTDNAKRFQRSARRLALPELPVDDFLSALHVLVQIDVEWVPSVGESSLYLRPFMFASEPYLGNRPANDVTFCVIASPVGSYFPKGIQPISVWVAEDFVRASPGGTGAAKCAGNYAAALAAQQQAATNGCEQVLFLDAGERQWVEELGGMNVFAVMDDNTLVTPKLTGTILEGVTRDSIITLATDAGYRVIQRALNINELFGQARSGRLRELFACGTAAVVNPIGRLVRNKDLVSISDGGIGSVTKELRERLLEIQFGKTDTTHGWLHQLV